MIIHDNLENVKISKGLVVLEAIIKDEVSVRSRWVGQLTRESGKSINNEFREFNQRFQWVMQVILINVSKLFVLLFYFVISYVQVKSDSSGPVWDLQMSSKKILELEIWQDIGGSFWKHFWVLHLKSRWLCSEKEGVF